MYEEVRDPPNSDAVVSIRDPYSRGTENSGPVTFLKHPTIHPSSLPARRQSMPDTIQGLAVHSEIPGGSGGGREASLVLVMCSGLFRVAPG